MHKLSKLNHYRKTIRLSDFDYAQDGAYFITIVTQNRVCLFGSVANDEMVLSDAGKMIAQVCEEMPLEHFIGAGMEPCLGRPRRGAPTRNKLTIPEIVGRFKSLTTRRYIEGVRQFDCIGK